MKKTNNPAKVLLIAFLVALVATVIITVIEHIVGPEKLFIGVLCLLPILLLWCLYTDQRKPTRH